MARFNLNLGHGFVSHSIFGAALEISSVAISGRYNQARQQILIPKLFFEFNCKNYQLKMVA